MREAAVTTLAHGCAAGYDSEAAAAQAVAISANLLAFADFALQQISSTESGKLTVDDVFMRLYQKKLEK